MYFRQVNIRPCRVTRDKSQETNISVIVIIIEPDVIVIIIEPDVIVIYIIEPDVIVNIFDLMLLLLYC